MPPPHFTNPPPLTTSARDALARFHCHLCSKGYSRQNEYDAHLTSYEHNHKQRLKDLKAMNRNMANETRPKDKEGKGSGLIKIEVGKKDGGEGKGGGFKKGGFKSAFKKIGEEEPVMVKVKVEEGAEERNVGVGSGNVVAEANIAKGVDMSQESETEDEGYECYDPRKPTGCNSGCKGRA